MILPCNYTLTASNIADYIPIFGGGPGVSGSEAIVRSSIGKKLYLEKIWAVVSANSKDGNTDLRFRRQSVSLMKVTYGPAVNGILESTTLLTPDNVIDPADNVNWEFSATASTAGSIRVNGAYALVYYLTQEES